MRELMYETSQTLVYKVQESSSSNWKWRYYRLQTNENARATL